MSSAQEAKLAGPTARYYERLRNDHDANPRMEDINVRGRDSMDGGFMARLRSDPVTSLKEKLSRWGWFAGVFNTASMGLYGQLEIDPNLPEDEKESKIPDSSSFDDDVAHTIIEEDSPYPEVRAAVKNYDEEVPANMIRVWTIGMFLVVVGASMNTLFLLRSPSIGLDALIAQVIAWPLGHGWAKVMPKRQFNTFGLFEVVFESDTI